MEQEDIDWNDWFYYDETSPSCLRWKVDRFTGRRGHIKVVSAGDVAGTLNHYDYYAVKLKKKIYLTHRVIYELFNGSLGGFHIDHVNGNRSDNKISNLRTVDRATNCRNMKKPSNNTSGVIGVSMACVRGNWYWRADYHDLNRKQHCKYFPILKHGHNEAFRLACEYRDSMIVKLNTDGAGYTERHGC